MWPFGKRKPRWERSAADARDRLSRSDYLAGLAAFDEAIAKAPHSEVTKLCEERSAARKAAFDELFKMIEQVTGAKTHQDVRYRDRRFDPFGQTLGQCTLARALADGPDETHRVERARQRFETAKAAGLKLNEAFYEPAAKEDEWFFWSQAGRQSGPFHAAAMRDEIEHGDVRLDTIVQHGPVLAYAAKHTELDGYFYTAEQRSRERKKELQKHMGGLTIENDSGDEGGLALANESGGLVVETEAEESSKTS